MHKYIALNGCEFIVLNQHCIQCLILWAQSSGTKSNGVARLYEMVKENVCRLIASRDRHPLR